MDAKTNRGRLPAQFFENERVCIYVRQSAPAGITMLQSQRKRVRRMRAVFWARPPLAAYAYARRTHGTVPGGRSLLADCGGGQPGLELKRS